MRRRLTGFQIAAIIWVVIVLMVAAAFFLAPEKPQAPPASAIAYEKKPDVAPVETASDVTPEPRPLFGPKEEPKPPNPEPKGDFAFRGRVIDSATNKPVFNATVIACVADKEGQVGATEERIRRLANLAREDDPRGKGFGSARTDVNGNYLLRLEEPGEYALLARRIGYVTTGEERGILSDGKPELTVDFRLSQGARVSGHVYESRSQTGAKGVKVKAVGIQRSEGETDADGKYEVTGLTPGSYEFRLDLANAPYTLTGVQPVKNVTIDMPDQRVTGIDFYVDPAGEVWGYVMTRNREPVPNTQVVLCTDASVITQFIDASVKQAPPMMGASDDTGYYQIVGVPLNKEWRLYAATDERAPQLSSPFLLTMGQRSAKVDIFLAAGTSVYGRVVSSEGGVVPGAEVVCLPSYTKLFSRFDTARAFRPTRSKEDGTFVIPHLPVGDYQVLAHKRGFKFAATGEPVYSDGYADIKNLELVLTPVETPEAAVYGTVMDGFGKPIEGVTLTLASVGSEDLDADANTAESDSDGRYAFEGVRSGLLMLTAEEPGYETKTVTDVKVNEPTDITMDAACLIAGRVLIQETNQPPANYTVAALPSSAGAFLPMMAMMQGNSRGNFSNPDGSFSLEVSPGDYLVEARAVGLTPGRTPVSVQAGQDMTGLTIYVRQSGARIQGRVTTADNKSPQGALVWLTGETSDSITPVMDGGESGLQVGADGAFEFSNLPAGAYLIRARLEGYSQSQYGPVVLGDGQVQSGIELMLGRGGALEGLVTINGRVAEGAIVVIANESYQDMKNSDETGHYRFDNVPPGSYLASATSLSFTGLTGLPPTAHGRVEIVFGQTTTFNFGETTNTAIVGFCTPPPKPMSAAYAILLLPGTPIDLEGLSLMNLAGLMQGGSALAAYLAGISPVGQDGYFRIDGLVAGEYQLEILYATIGEALTGKVHHVFSGPVTVLDGQPTELDLPVNVN